MDYATAGVSRVGMPARDPHQPTMRSQSTREILDFLGTELECLDKASHELAARLDFFLEPDRPSVAGDLKSANQEPCSELNGRIRDLAAHVMQIRNRLSCMASRAN